jgi:hypothetical protein
MSSVPAVMESRVSGHPFALFVGIKPVPVMVTTVDAPAKKAVGCMEVTVGVTARAQGVITMLPGLKVKVFPTQSSDQASSSIGAPAATVAVNVITVELTSVGRVNVTFGSSA